MDKIKLDSILINPPVSSPLHPQLNLPLLKGYLGKKGYKTQVVDVNILFFNEFLSKNTPGLTMDECRANPLRILEFYSTLERDLGLKSKEYRDFRAGLRSLSMAYDRTSFDEVKKAVDDETSGPFHVFFTRLILKDILPLNPAMICISITFQDQIIPAFILAGLVRKMMKGTVIVLGGQMITRCYESLSVDQGLSPYFDHLVLWDGEVPLLHLHEAIIDGKRTNRVNVISNDGSESVIDRSKAALSASDIPYPDYSDLDFNRYYFPEMLVPFQTTRGCYGTCAFCAIPAGANKYMIRTVDHVIEDLVRIQEETHARYGRKARFFKFMEDTSSPKLLHDMAVEIEKQKLEVYWETFARLEDAFTAKGFLEQLYRGGCRKIHWGLESGDPSILSSMNKKITVETTDRVLQLSGEAGILNFCFVLVGFPGETDDMRKALTDYIVDNRHIHTLTLATFDLTRKSPMERRFTPDNDYGLDCIPAKDFQVRLPYTVHGGNWKNEIVPKAHRMMLDIITRRTDIGLMTLFPDQIRMILCQEYGNTWAVDLAGKIGSDMIRDMLVHASDYVENYHKEKNLPLESIPEPFVREHLRSKEDLYLIAQAVQLRKNYETRRIDQV